MQVPRFSVSEEVVEIRKLLENETNLRKVAEEEVKNLRSQLGQNTPLAVWFYLDYKVLFYQHPLDFFDFQACNCWYIRFCFDVLGRWRCRNAKASENSGGRGSSEEET